MTKLEILSDYTHPAVVKKAKELTEGKEKPLDKVEAIFYFMRDRIKFGFPSTFDEVKASDVLKCGFGYCTPKATLFLALCKAANLPARIHCGLIDIEIMRGIFPSFTFPFLPKVGSHSWVDIKINGDWEAIDSYINDKVLYEKALECLGKSEREIGYSIAHKNEKSSCDFNFGEKGFAQMGAVIEDHGAWNDLSEYINSDKYIRMNRMLLLSYPIVAAINNRTVAKIRER